MIPEYEGAIHNYPLCKSVQTLRWCEESNDPCTLFSEVRKKCLVFMKLNIFETTLGDMGGDGRVISGRF